MYKKWVRKQWAAWGWGRSQDLNIGISLEETCKWKIKIEKIRLQQNQFRIKIVCQFETDKPSFFFF